MYSVFAALMKERGSNINEVARATGISTTSLYDWKAGRYTPKAEKRKKIAEYFGVSLDYLDTGDESLRDPSAEIEQARVSNPDMDELFSLVKKASPEEIKQAIRVFHALIGD